MICPSCQSDSIPFLHAWRKAGYGTYKCPACGATSRFPVSVPLVAVTILQSVSLVLIGFYLAGLSGFVVGLVMALLIDAAIDYKFRHLVLVQANGESPNNSLQA